MACSQTPRLRIFEQTSYRYPPPQPIRLYIADEADLGGGYYETLRFHHLRPLKEFLKEGLSATTIKVTVAGGPSERGQGFTMKLNNPFVVVEDSSTAEMIARIGVNAMVFGESRSIAEKLSVYHTLGILGVILLGREGEVGALAADCRVEYPGKREAIYEFSFVGTSKAVSKKAEGFEQALEVAVGSFADGLLAPK